MIQVNSSQTQRIIRTTEAAGAEFISSKTALEQCLQICLKWYDDALICTSRSSQRMQRSAARRLQISVQDMLAQLKTDRSAYHRWFCPTADVFSKQLLDLSDSIDTALGLHSDSEPQSGLESDFVDYLGYQDHFKLRSPLEWLVGFYLCEAYELNFKTKKSIRDNYLSFAMAVIKELKIKNGQLYYSAETIRRAARDQRDRRKAKKVDATEYEINRQMHLHAACGRRW